MHPIISVFGQVSDTDTLLTILTIVGHAKRRVLQIQLRTIASSGHVMETSQTSQEQTQNTLRTCLDTSESLLYSQFLHSLVSNVT